MPPLVLDLAEQFRQQLLDREATALQAMVRTWLDVERRIQGELEAIVAEIQATGQIRPDQLRKMTRYRTLLRQIAQELTRYSETVDASVQQRSFDAATTAWEQANILQQTAISTVPGVAVQFDRLPVPATEYLVGLTRPGTPLRGVLIDAAGVGVQGLESELIAGLAQGLNPREIARRAIRQGLGRSFTRMQTIARTEVLRSYRAATLDNYRQSKVTQGYRRIASKSIRTCIACLAVDGREYPLDVPFEEHPNGRCVAIPVIIGRPYRDIQTGPEWFSGQDEATQRSMMGPERYDLWRNGRVSWDDLATLHEDETWGNSWQVTPVYRLKEIAG